MNVNYQELIKKILSFWEKYEYKGFSVDDLKAYFNHYELATILYNNNFWEKHYFIVSRFQDKIDDFEGLFTENEISELFSVVQTPSVLFKYFDDDKLLSFISDDNYDEIIGIVNMLSSDEAKIKAFNMVSDSEIKVAILCNLESDELKLKNLNRVSPKDKSIVINSLKDDSLLEKNITFFSKNKSDIIKRLSSDEKKVYYLKKFFKILKEEDKIDIIASLKDDNKVLECLAFCNDKVKVEVVNFIRRKVNTDGVIDNTIQFKIIQMMKSKKGLVEILSVPAIDEELIIRFIDQITNSKDLFKILCYGSLSDENKIKYLDRISNDNDKIDIIKSIHKINLQFKALSYINDEKLLFKFMEHCEKFPDYSDEYKYLIELYVNRYNINEENLLFVVKNISLSVLKVIENPNIMKILNSSHESFFKVMKFFDKEQLKMDHSSMNDILNTLLQREFRINESEIILLFPNMLNAIENNNKEFLMDKINEISQFFDIDVELSKNNWNLSQFIDLLLNKDKSSIECLHVIVAKFIRDRRNNYVQENLQLALENSSIVKYEKKDLMKNFISNCPVEIVLSLFYNPIGVQLTNEEQYLLNNKDLLERIILYKKNPDNFQGIPDDIKINMKNFSNLFEKIVACHSVSSFEQFSLDSIKKKIEFEEVDMDFLVDIMMHLDMDKLEKGLFNNQELFDKLMKLWKQYKLGGWGNTFLKLLDGAGVVADDETMANFIQYFELSYKSLQEKIEKGELANMSLTALLDLASCYSLESKKYSMVFGDENFKYIAGDPGPNKSTMLKEKRIEKAVQFLKVIRSRDYVTVPPIDKNFSLKNGKSINIVVGNFSNIMNLTYGERTGACMRIGGAGRQLFDFCLKDENGFHIRFTNSQTGKFVSRVSGFRNGNTVFLNQLRFSEDSNYTNVDVVEACKLIADEIISLSKDSPFPIDNVIITSDYAMAESNMKRKNFNIPDPQFGMKKFYFDFDSTGILLSSSSQNNELVPTKLGVKNVPKYLVQRDKQKILYNRECQEYVAHLKCLDQVLAGKSVDDIEVTINNNLIVCLAGEDWCVTIDKEGNLEEYIMGNTNNKQQAIDEVQAALVYLKENIEKEVTLSNNMYR